MAKKKAKKKARVQRPSKWHILLLGILIGAGISWLPFEEFSPVQFSSNPFPDQIPPSSESFFSNHLPTTTPLIQREGFIVAYNGQTRNPHWVYHKLTPSSTETKISREGCEFKEDHLIPQPVRATKADYHASGFDRGHLCPAADTQTVKALENTFFLSGISPQVGAFNRGIWKKLEHHVRDLTRQYRAIHVFSGPLYLSNREKDGKRYVKYQVIGKHQVAVPTHFFMLIFAELPTKKMLSKAYILPNKALDSHLSLKKFSVTTEEIETASGVMFTHILESQNGG